LQAIPGIPEIIFWRSLGALDFAFKAAPANAQLVEPVNLTSTRLSDALAADHLALAAYENNF
jgi:hypothetical protein